jgi:hypothetical protein
MSQHYDLHLERSISGLNDLTTQTIKVRLSRASAYTFSAAHVVMTSVGAGVGTDPTLGSKTVTGGVFDAADSVWTAVTAGAAIDQLIVYRFVTNDADSVPLAFINGFTVTPNGGDITAVWQSTSPKIFKI